MVGRKAPKSGKAKVTVAKDLTNKTEKKLKKLKKREPSNALDLQKVTKIKQLCIDVHTKDVKQQLIDVQGSLGGISDGHKELLQYMHPDGKRSMLALLILLRDGLHFRRLEALEGLSELLMATPHVVRETGLKLLLALTPRIVDDDENVRRHAIALTQNCIFGGLRQQLTAGEFCQFCENVRSTLWMQQRLVLSNLHKTKQRDGVLLVHKTLLEAPSSLFQDDAFVTRVSS